MSCASWVPEVAVSQIAINIASVDPDEMRIGAGRSVPNVDQSCREKLLAQNAELTRLVPSQFTLNRIHIAEAQR